MVSYNDFSETMTRGDTHVCRFSVRLDGVVQDTTSWQQFWWTAKRSLFHTDAQAIMQLTEIPSAGLTAINHPQGLHEVRITPTHTAALVGIRHAVELFVDVQGKDPLGQIWTVLRGRLIVQPSVTRATT